GLPPELVWRHPFPGPGLGIRLLCADGGEDAAALAPLGTAAAPIAARCGLTATPLPVRSVGVKADLRSYEHPLLLTGAGPWDRVVEAAGQIFRTVAGVNRCVWNLEPEAPPEIRSAAATVTRARLDLLRAADACVMDALRRHGLYAQIWQCPTVLVPLTAPGRGNEFVVIRPVLSERAMTAAPAELPPAVRAELRDALLALPGVWGVGLDVTSKPPGTIEWE
ncbi:MAG TPA: glutamine-hydrolyzing GMP synthase, partial [Acidobacteriota bacterium]|nr:glutamine-hydrolyzing GMP synthase [Acidobacteriota bacterium]